MEIRFTHTPDDSDFKAAAGMLAKKYRRQLLVSGALFTLLVVTIWIVRIDSSSGHLLFFFLGAVTAQLAALLTYKSTLVKTIKSIPGYADTNSYVISSDGIQFISPCCSGNLHWSHFQSFVEADTHFFLMKGPHPYGYPKRVMSAQEQDHLRALLKEKLPVK